MSSIRNNSVPVQSQRAEWVKPAIRRMEAGSAEQGSNARSDGGFNFS